LVALKKTIGRISLRWIKPSVAYFEVYYYYYYDHHLRCKKLDARMWAGSDWLKLRHKADSSEHINEYSVFIKRAEA
jgi:hypothetical protein